MALVRIRVRDDRPSTRHEPRAAIVVKFAGMCGNENPVNALLVRGLLHALEHLPLKALDVAMEQMDSFQPMLAHQPVHGDHRRLERLAAMARTDESIDKSCAQAVQSKVQPTCIEVCPHRLDEETARLYHARRKPQRVEAPKRAQLEHHRAGRYER